jgi:exonuclease III
VAAINNLKKQLNFSGYDFFYNSRFASRGVGILIKKDLSLNIVNTKNDRIGNILVLEVSTQNNINFLLASIYGPNDNNEFFADLSSFFESAVSNIIVCGSDFNCTWDASPADINIDTLFMRNIPSAYRTNKILSIVDKFKLTDPFRLLYPNRMDYTYIPNAMANRNRSRIDFFIVSENIVPKITDADIPMCKLSTLFDHKPTLVTTRKKNQPRDPNKIKESILDMIPVKLVVEVAVKEFYLNNADPDTIPRYIVNNLRMEFGRVYTRLLAATNLELTAVRENTLNNDTKLQIALYLTLLREAGGLLAHPFL